MSMDYAYQQLHRQADALHYKVKDAIDQPDHPSVRTLHDQLRYLIDDFAQHKRPHNIEDRIKGIMQLLEPARNGSQPFISVSDAVAFHDHFEDIRRELRHHPDYS